ncbi:MAG: hypothetical protein HY717_18025 [Planctomycetes bacterium]|nr:hypothetical protein [Planctomycetota bacterium]
MSLGTFLLAAAVGGVILFVWGFLAWVVLPLHRPFLKRYHGEEEDRLREAIRRATRSDGLYLLPCPPHPRPKDPAQQKAIEAVFRERYEAGPVALLVARIRGGKPMDPALLLRGLIIEILNAALIAGLLALAAPGIPHFSGRFVLVLGIGAAVWLGAHVLYWNWFHFPLGYTLSQLIDNAIGSALLGLWLAWILAPA